MKVWKVTEINGSCDPLIIDQMAVWDDITGGMENEEVGNKYQIEIIEMDEQDFKNLPEWSGF